MSVPRRPHLLALGSLVAVSALVVLCGPSAAGAGAHSGAELREGAALVPLRAGPALLVAERDVPLQDRFRLPDGTWAPALNGAKNVVPLVWPSDRPYAPIVERFVDALGFERYRHADGSECLTVPQWRPDLGRMDSNTVLFHPVESLPLEPETTRPGEGSEAR